MRNWIAATMVIFGSAGLCSAAELAVLQNGFTIRHERHEVLGETTRLYTGTSASDFIDVPTAQIANYAPDDPPAAAAAALPGQKPLDVNALMKDAGTKHGLDPDFISSVVHAESGFNVKAVSPKGAQGLMQLMPKTAADLGVKDSFDPVANVDAGTKYLRALLDQYNGNVAKALAAYNAGANRVAQYNGVPPYAETHAYVKRIINEYNRKKAAEEKTQASAKKSARATSTSAQ